MDKQSDALKTVLETVHAGAHRGDATVGLVFGGRDAEETAEMAGDLVGAAVVLLYKALTRNLPPHLHEEAVCDWVRSELDLLRLNDRRN